MSRLITVKVSTHPSELAVAKTFLEDQGVICFIQDELTIQVHPFYSNAVGGVKLQVPEEEAEEAILLLVEGGFAQKEDYEIPESTMKLVKIYEKISSYFQKKK